MKVNSDCKYYKGNIPCKFHKINGVHCDKCDSYEKIDKRVLIIKLGAIGDVIRTTPLLHKLKEVYPKSEVTWLTYYPDVVPSSIVDCIMDFNLKNIVALLANHFDIIYNLDKDLEACALSNQISADIKNGFMLKNGKCAPINEKARDKWLTGIFNDISITNTKSYPEEIFEICGFKFNKEKYILDFKDEYNWNINEEKPLIGLNTGCSPRWPNRTWGADNWVKLSKILKNKGFGVVLLGGEDEDEKNKEIAKQVNVTYPGYFPLFRFFSLFKQCDLIVTGVTMAMHIAIALNRKIILLNNIFNKNEFELYGLGEIVEPNPKSEKCYYQVCNDNCIDRISIENVAELCVKILIEKK